MLIMINMAASMVAAIGNFLTCSFFGVTCMCMCAYVHTCMFACRKNPPMSPDTPLTHLPRPLQAEAAQIVKTL